MTYDGTGVDWDEKEKNPKASKYVKIETVLSCLCVTSHFFSQSNTSHRIPSEPTDTLPSIVSMRMVVSEKVGSGESTVSSWVELDCEHFFFYFVFGVFDLFVYDKIL